MTHRSTLCFPLRVQSRSLQARGVVRQAYSRRASTILFVKAYRPIRFLPSRLQIKQPERCVNVFVHYWEKTGPFLSSLHFTGSDASCFRVMGRLLAFKNSSTFTIGTTPRRRLVQL